MTMLTARAGGLTTAGPRWRRRGAVALAGVLTGAGLVAAAGVPTASAVPVLTDFAMTASGFSTQIRGGSLPVQSSPTGVAGVACTRFSDEQSRNNTAAVNIPPVASVLQIGATETHAFTDLNGSTVSSNAHNDVARVLIGNKAVAALEIEGIETRARAFNDGTDFGHNEIVRVAKVTQWTAGIPSNVASIPVNQDLNGEVLDIPGLARVTFGDTAGGGGAASAFSRATGLVIDLHLTNSNVTIGSAKARIQGGAVDGIMSGSVYGSQLRGLGGIANSGRTALVSLPCLGTDDVFKSRELLGVNIPGLANLDEVLSRVKGSQGGGEASATGISTITRAGFVGRQLVITGIRASGMVTRHSDGTYTHDSSTTVASITLAGEELTLPRPGRVLEIPGVARIRVGVVNETPTGIRVVGVRVQLLQGSVISSTLNLANVNLNVEEG
ncbi:MAG: choice-of-anchor P family protein [Nocardioidaceae bacterium]